MEYQVEWKVVGRDALEIPSQVGGRPVKVDKNQVYLQASFSLTEEIRTEYVLFDAGHSGSAHFVEVFLNGISIGDTTGRKSPVKYCVHRSLIKSGLNELVIRASGFERSGWPDNGQYTVVGRLEFSPFKWIKLEQFAPAGEIDSVDKKKDSVNLNTASEKIISLSFIKGIKAVRLKISNSDSRDDFLVDELCLVKKPRYEEIKVEQDKARTGITCSYGTAIINKSSSSLVILPSDNLQGVGPFTIESTPNGILLRWPITDSEHIFGLGENTMHGMDKKGKRENIWVIHSFDKCDKPVPFMLSTAGYSLLLHSSYYSVFDLGSQKSNEGFCFCNSSCAEFILFLERDFRAMVRDFTALTGRPPMPPRWIFGYYQSTTEKVSQKELEKSVDVFNKKKIPVDVIGIDPNWQKPGFQSWQWDKNYFPKPQQFLTKLKKEDIRLQLWTGPFINRSSRLFEQAVKSKFVFRTKKSDIGSVDWWMGTDAVLIDFTNSKAVEWWAKLLAPLVKSGISILKTDGGDTSETPPDLISPSSNRSMRELHNLYPILFAKAVSEGMQKSAGKERILTWIRTGFTGIGRYPCCWGGDQNANFHGGRVLIKAGQQAGLMGIPFWSHDLGGFGGKPTPEYYLRSFQ
jgi:alpha-glucosidase (family GH31 glycosyl hydrolase)